jgi:hypothetical protein
MHNAHMHANSLNQMIFLFTVSCNVDTKSSQIDCMETVLVYWSKAKAVLVLIYKY